MPELNDKTTNIDAGAEAGAVLTANTAESSSISSNGQVADAGDVSAGQVAEFLGTTPASLEKFQRFVEANGFDSAFSKLKKDVSTPAETKAEQPAQPTQPTQPAQATETPQPAQPAEPQMAKGYLSPKDFALRQYFATVANEEKYSAIKGDITSGKVLTEMSALGIKPTDAQGNYNDEQIHAFLDLKAATVPAKPAVVEPTNTPTVQYTELDGDISTADQANKIVAETMRNRASGTTHPKYAEAKKFLAQQMGIVKPNEASQK